MEDIQEISVSGTMDAATANEVGKMVFGRGKFEQIEVAMSHAAGQLRCILRRKREGAQEGRKG